LLLLRVEATFVSLYIDFFYPFYIEEDKEVSGGSSSSYFAEYALENGLCDPVATSPDFEVELITEISNTVESWFKDNYEVAQSILLSAYNEITRVCES